MPIAFTCPHCGVQTSVADEFAGQTGPCASCGKPVTIPPFGGAPGYAPPAKKSGGPSVLVIVLVVLVPLLGLCVVCGWILAALYLPEITGVREAASKLHCSNNLKQIGMALQNYESSHGCFPPAVITDEDGRPMHSWRAAILPYLEQASLFERYDRNEPWDGPNNSALADIALECFRCPSDGEPVERETNYVMITGEGTIGGLPNEAIDVSDVRDGMSNTIMVVEVAGSGIHWMEPRDLTIDEVLSGINSPSGTGIRSNHPGGVNVLFADGSIRFLDESVTAEELKAFCTRNGMETVSRY